MASLCSSPRCLIDLILFFNALFCRQDRAKAVETLVKDLKVFASFNEELFKEITQLLTLDNFRYFYLHICG